MATDAVGNLVAASCGLELVDLLTGGSHIRPRHSSHRPCGHGGSELGTRQITLGASCERAHTLSRLLPTHEDVTAVKVKEHATKTGRASKWQMLGNNFVDKFATVGADAHKPPMCVHMQQRVSGR